MTGPNDNATKDIPMPLCDDSANARRRFPRGLTQPAGTFRFSVDALLLACFFSPGNGCRVLDLGSGCGVVGLGMLCRSPKITVTGIDCLAESVAASVHNAAQLGFAERCVFLRANLDSPRLFALDAEQNKTGGQDEIVQPPLHKRTRVLPSEKTRRLQNLFTQHFQTYASKALRASPDQEVLKEALPAESFDMVVANPPYRQRNRGRLPQSPARLTALFESSTTGAAFCRAAATALKPDGRFGIIYPAAREADISACLARHGLFVTRILPLTPKSGREPTLLLIESVKAKTQGSPLREAPLVLHSGHGGHTREALAYCPFLS